MANNNGDDPAIIKKKIERVIRKAEKGDIPSMIVVANSYANGAYVPKDWLAAEAWLRKAGELGSEEAYKKLAELLNNGNGVAQDLEEAFDIYHELMLGCDIDAMEAVGIAYKLGRGIHKDEEKGAYFIKKAFEFELDFMDDKN